MIHHRMCLRNTVGCCLVLIQAILLSPTASAQGRPAEADYFSHTPAEWDAFGYQVAEHSNRLLVSAPSFDSQASSMVYLFDKHTKEVVHVFNPSDDVAGVYGVNIAISDECIVISSAARWVDSHILVYDPVTFERIAMIGLSPEMVSYSFGIRMDLDGADLLIGLPFSDVYENSAGQALLYHAPTATLLEELTPNEHAPYASFGDSVQINSKHIAISAIGLTTNGHDYGAVYLFDRDNGQQLNKLISKQVGESNTSFGQTTKLNNNSLAITHSSWTMADINNQTRSVQVYDMSDPADQTMSYAVIEMPDTDYNLQSFGLGLAMNENYIAVFGTMELGHLDWTKGVFIYELQSLSLIEVVRAQRLFQLDAYLSPVLDSTDQLFFGHMLNGIEGATGPGIVHQYQLTNCPQDLNHDGSLDIEDINQFIKARMDWNDTLSFNYFDISAFVEDFLAGCH